MMHRMTPVDPVLPVDRSGRVYVVGSVRALHPEAQAVDEVLEGWRNQQLCRNLHPYTMSGRVRLVERCVERTNEFPCTWTGDRGGILSLEIATKW